MPRFTTSWLAVTALFGSPALAGEPAALGEVTTLTPPADYGDPAWSPDGAAISFTGPGARGLYLVPAAGGALHPIPGTASTVGFRHRWVDDPARLVCPRRGEAPALEIDPDAGRIKERSTPREPVELQRDDLVRHAADGDVLLTHGEDRFFDPQPSPDGGAVAFVGLSTGVHVIDLASGAVQHLGAGTRPTWSPDGAWVLYERTADDGTDLTGAELVAWRRHDERSVDLTATPDALERHPAVSPDGRWLAFSRDGAICVAPLLLEAP